MSESMSRDSFWRITARDFSASILGRRFSCSWSFSAVNCRTRFTQTTYVCNGWRRQCHKMCATVFWTSARFAIVGVGRRCRRALPPPGLWNLISFQIYRKMFLLFELVKWNFTTVSAHGKSTVAPPPHSKKVLPTSMPAVPAFMPTPRNNNRQYVCIRKRKLSVSFCQRGTPRFVTRKKQAWQLLLTALWKSATAPM